jgi:large subunit ribosomal protein L10
LQRTPTGCRAHPDSIPTTSARAEVVLSLATLSLATGAVQAGMKKLCRKEENRLPITRKEKELLVEKYRELVRGSGAIVFTNYRGTSVKQINALRARLQESGASYVVTKNTLLGIALQQEERVAPEELLAGPNGVVFAGEDISKSVTALKDWIKEAKIVEITGAILENSVLDATAATGLSELPTREQVLAKILGTINAPAQSLVGIINAPGSSLVRVINAYVEKQKEAAA